MEYCLNETNVEHLAKHGIRPDEAEYVVERARPPYPPMIGDEKRIVVGRLPTRRYVQVIYVPSSAIPGAVYVIHARELTEREKRRFHRRTR